MQACRHLLYSFLLLLVTLFGLSAPGIAAAPNCESEARITEEFDNGAQWDMCWESRIRENLVLSDVYFTPPEGEPLRVLSSARLSQLHVAYDDSDVTYNDVTQYGLGGGYLLELSEADCPSGHLLNVHNRPALCVWRGASDSSYRTLNRASQTQSLNLFSVSQVGAYAYILSWSFHADGRIEPSIGATGALQRSASDTELPFGRVLQGDPDTLWLSHTHNYYWRLDFDIGEEATDDVFSEQRYLLGQDGRTSVTREVFSTEQARRIDPERQASWTVSENAIEGSAGYRIEPIRSGHTFRRQAVEPYTDFDMFVTVANDCERFASQNARFNPDCLNHVLQYVDGQSINQQDIVLWHRVSFHHTPRNEDQRNMHTHWDGFVIEPVNVLQASDSWTNEANSTPVVDEVSEHHNQVGDVIKEQLSATDADGDHLAFNATGLPPGISMSTHGVLIGTLNTEGKYTVAVTVFDDSAEQTTEFTWQVAKSQTGKKSGGTLGMVGLSGLLLFSLVRVAAVKKALTWLRSTHGF